MAYIEKLNGKSLDIVKQNIETLKKLFPEIVREGKIDFDSLKLILGEEVDESSEKFDFTWAGKKKAIRRAMQVSTGTLRPCKEESKNWDTTKNLYIEGDNLEVLRLLQQAYYNRIKMIYIDPPYNTGNDFVYNDDFAETVKEYVENSGQALQSNPETSGRFHSNWLNMMYPRLRLARNLLSEDGVIFISIDDNEVDNLRKLCNEIFGEENFVASITIQSNPRGRQSDQFVASVHDYVVVYAKSVSTCEINGAPLSDEQKSEFNQKDENGPYRLLGLRQRGSASRREDRPDMYFPIYVDKNTLDVSLVDTGNCAVVYPRKSDGSDGRWMWGKDKCQNDKRRLVAKMIERRGEYDIFVKDYLYKNECERTRKYKTIWDAKGYNNQFGTQEVKRILGGDYMSFPKSTELMLDILRMGCSSEGIILDFFSGSATTAHAVMQLNAEDGGHRRFIMVQLPEPCDEKSEAFKAGYKNICEIGKERIRRAGDKIVAETGKTDLDIGFKVFKLDTSNLKEWDSEKEDVEKQIAMFGNPIKEDRTPLDVVYEIMLKYGVDLTMPVQKEKITGKTVYNIGDGALYVCLDDDISVDLAREIAKRKPLRVVFKDAGFKDDNAKLNVVQILKHCGIEEIRSI